MPKKRSEKEEMPYYEDVVDDEDQREGRDDSHRVEMMAKEVFERVRLRKVKCGIFVCWK